VTAPGVGPVAAGILYDLHMEPFESGKEIRDQRGPRRMVLDRDEKVQPSAATSACNAA
jgi:hypothetical protein